MEDFVGRRGRIEAKRLRSLSQRSDLKGALQLGSHVGALVTTGNEASFKTHARRLLKEGVSAEALRHTVLVTFGATTTFSQISDGLHWVDDVTAK